MATAPEPKSQLSEQLLRELASLEQNYQATITSLPRTKVLTGSSGWEKVVEFESASKESQKPRVTFQPSLLFLN